LSRFYVPKGSVRGKTMTIEGAEAHHIIDVMRLRPSDAVVAFDGTGKEYAGTIRSVGKGAVVIDVIRTIEPGALSNVRITLIQAIPKKAKMDYIVEKATELGVSCVRPVFTARTIPDWDAEKRSSCVKRWRKIALEASKQSSRTDIPAVDDIGDFRDSIKRPGDFDLALIPTLGGRVERLSDAVRSFRGKSIAIAIGPEGDFTSEEVALAASARFRPVSLGPRVLKSDTAGLAALAILDYELTG
jgi:16S rRNA (uracil1498-N3)-methyltransferase